jgi:hypothetical protein
MRRIERIDVLEPILKANIRELLNEIPNLNEYIESNSIFQQKMLYIHTGGFS